MVVLYHPGYIPGNTHPVADDYVAFLEGTSSECQRASSRFASNEVDYYEVGTFSTREEAEEYISQRGLRVWHG